MRWMQLTLVAAVLVCFGLVSHQYAAGEGEDVGRAGAVGAVRALSRNSFAANTLEKCSSRHDPSKESLLDCTFSNIPWSSVFLQACSGMHDVD